MNTWLVHGIIVVAAIYMTTVDAYTRFHVIFSTRVWPDSIRSYKDEGIAHVKLAPSDFKKTWCP